MGRDGRRGADNGGCSVVAADAYKSIGMLLCAGPMPRCFSNVASRASFVLPYASAGSISANALFSSVDEDALFESSPVLAALPLCFWMILCSSSASLVSGAPVVEADDDASLVDAWLMGDEPGNDSSMAGPAGVVSCLVSCGRSFCDIGRPSSDDSSCRSEFSDCTSFLFFSMSAALMAALPVFVFVFDLAGWLSAG